MKFGPNRRFQFHKRSQFFIRPHNETFSVAVGIQTLIMH